jgi:queuine tRNA-ribosyltransferase
MTCSIQFRVDAVDPNTSARAGTLTLNRGEIETPVFMPVGTQAAIRGLPPSMIPTTTQIILANAYHLHQRPGEELVEKMGGLHQFMQVDLPILTDSGGFQVFSLKKRQISEEGVAFQYEVDGKRSLISPEISMEIQQKLGSDIAMAFDECLPADTGQQAVAQSIDRTSRWAARSLKSHYRDDQSLFGIVQGGMFEAERRRSADQITGMGFDGFAIGGLAVGESPELMREVAFLSCTLLPEDRPRYLMGVGRPRDLLDLVMAGVDMFDCVIPTRHARSGCFYTFMGRIRITDKRYRRDSYAPDTNCECYTCKNFSRAYLHHLFRVGEILGSTLATVHNLHFFAHWMKRIREAIVSGTLRELAAELSDKYPVKN